MAGYVSAGYSHIRIPLGLQINLSIGANELLKIAHYCRRVTYVLQVSFLQKSRKKFVF